MNFKDIEKKSANEINKMLSEERAKLHDMRFKTSVNQIKDVSKISVSKKTIARLLTRLKQLEYENR